MYKRIFYIAKCFAILLLYLLWLQIAAVIGERESENGNEIGISHIVVPAAYTPSVTAFYYSHNNSRHSIQRIMSDFTSQSSSSEYAHDDDSKYVLT